MCRTSSSAAMISQMPQHALYGQGCKKDTNTIQLVLMFYLIVVNNRLSCHLNSAGCSCFSSPLVQFNLLHSKFHLCSVPTRALLLSAYIKFINLFPEVKTTIQGVLRSDSQLRNADVELQQRAVEYLRLSCIASTDILVSHSWRYCHSSFCLGFPAL